MAVATTTVAAITTTAVVKKIVDEVFEYVKTTGVAKFFSNRASVKDRNIAIALNRITKVKTLWNTEKEVSLYDFYFPSKIIFPNDVKKNVESLRDLGAAKNFVIQGTAGQGKSIFLRFLCGQEISNSTSTGRIPVFIELRRIRSDYSLKRLILEALEKIKLPSSDEAWRVYAESGKFILLLDAFDEIDPAYVQDAIAELEHLSDVYHDSLQIIVTSRPDSDIQNSARFRVFRLCPLTDEDHLPLLKKLCIEKGQAESLHTVLKKSSADVSNLLTTPLMVTLLVILYKSMQTVPDTVPKFYEELFDVLFYRHDQSKPGFRRKRYTDLDDDAIKKVFSAFCFYTRLKNYGILSNDQLVDCCDNASKVSNVPINPQKFKLEISKTVCLMQQDGFEISFIHKSVAQYYAASFVAKSSDKFAEAFYNMVSDNYHDWTLELKFLKDIDTYRFSKYFYLPSAELFSMNLKSSLDGPDDEVIAALENYVVDNTFFRCYTRDGKAISLPIKRSDNVLFGGWRRKDVLGKFGYEFTLEWIIRFARLIEFKWDTQAESFSMGDGQSIPFRSIISSLPADKVRAVSEEIFESMKLSRANALASLKAEKEKLKIMAELMPVR